MAPFWRVVGSSWAPLGRSWASFPGFLDTLGRLLGFMGVCDLILEGFGAADKPSWGCSGTLENCFAQMDRVRMDVDGFSPVEDKFLWRT